MNPNRGENQSFSPDSERESAFPQDFIDLSREFGARLDFLVQTEALFRDLAEKSGITIYNPLDYAWDLHERYLRLCLRGEGKVFFLGMNPGPFGMMQTGVPFGAVPPVRDWMGLRGEVRQPKDQHPKRPVLGLECGRTEASGKRLWQFFSSLSPKAEDFFEAAQVMNYCPLAFLGPTGANVTPDKLPRDLRNLLQAECDRFLSSTLEFLRPRALVGIGNYAYASLSLALERGWSASAARPTLCKIQHPSPANPQANKGWEESVVRDLGKAGLWPLNAGPSGSSK